MEETKSIKNKADVDPKITEKYGEIPRDKNDYPDFSNHAAETKSGKVGDFGENRSKDISSAWSDMEKSGKYTKEQLENYKNNHTWHHHQDGTKMQLVPRDLHKAVSHTGSVSLMDKAKAGLKAAGAAGLATVAPYSAEAAEAGETRQLSKREVLTAAGSDIVDIFDPGVRDVFEIGTSIGNAANNFINSARSTSESGSQETFKHLD